MLSPTQFDTCGGMAMYATSHPISMWDDSFKAESSQNIKSSTVVTDIKLDNRLEDALHEMLGASKQYEHEANKPPDKFAGNRYLARNGAKIRQIGSSLHCVSAYPYRNNKMGHDSECGRGCLARNAISPRLLSPLARLSLIFRLLGCMESGTIIDPFVSMDTIRLIVPSYKRRHLQDNDVTVVVGICSCRFLLKQGSRS